MSETSVVVEKSLRSVFVGNIPYEATEEKLREIFCQVGPVVSFKLMHDRESGKPKGYGFCEYKDQETALSAMRNLNAFEIGGRPLRVDNACTEKSRMEMQSLMMGPVVESPYGNDVDASQAPEAISNAVASLPPEQMFELMRQMQVCVRSNRTEARTMLLNNPQLAYALLQAQVVMRIIDPKTAVQLLHGEAGNTAAPIQTKTEPGFTNGTTKPISIKGVPPVPSTNGSGLPGAGGGIANAVGGTMFGSPHQGPPPNRQVPPQRQAPQHQQGPPPHQGAPQHQGQPQNISMQGPPGPPPPGGQHFPGGDYDLRGPPQRGPDHDMRMRPTHGNFPPPQHQDFDNSRFGSRDARGAGDFEQRDARFRDQQQFPPRDRGGRTDHRDGRGRDDEPPRDASDRDLRQDPSREARDPRARGAMDDSVRGVPPPSAPSPAGQPAGLPPNLTTGLAGHDQEKASLIMQVLQLSEEQIRMLPPEQQASILQLKEQIQQSQN